jgi:uncharacterized membrane protein YoaK (UPF0700 family)
VTAHPTVSKPPDDAVLIRLLLVMTVVTGAVDAVSILRLGHVFVANMTGNVVFLGFAVAGAKGFSVSASLVALGAFLAGAAVVGRHFPSLGRLKMRGLGQLAAAEAALFAAAAAVAVTTGGTAARYAMMVLLAVAMGAQNAFVRRLAVPNLTTTVLTMTLTGLAEDRWDFASATSQTKRELAAVAAIVFGAVLGALLVLHAATEWTLGAAAGLLAAVAAAAVLVRRPIGPSG